jgi:hypothetical protein
LTDIVIVGIGIVGMVCALIILIGGIADPKMRFLFLALSIVLLLSNALLIVGVV